MESLSCQKAILRAAVKEKAKQISLQKRAEASEKIFRNIVSMEQYKAAKIIFCFVGSETEVDTSQIIKKAFSDGKRIAVPLCVGKGVMEARFITSLSQLSVGKYKILEPPLDSVVALPKEIDFALIPCVSCNSRGERLGHGGGYYDRFMENSVFFKALICFSWLMADEIPVNKYDIPVNAVINEEKIIIL